MKDYYLSPVLSSIVSWTSGWINQFKEGKSEGIVLRNREHGEHWGNKKFIDIAPWHVCISEKANLYGGVYIPLKSDKQREAAYKLLKGIFIYAPYVLVETSETDYYYRKYDAKLNLLRRKLGLKIEQDT